MDNTLTYFLCDDEITKLSNVLDEYDAEEFRKQRANYGKQQEVVDVLSLSNQSLISAYETQGIAMDNRVYTLFLLVANQHPRYVLVNRKDEDLEDPRVYFDKYKEPLVLRNPTDPSKLYQPDGKEVKWLRSKIKLTQQEFGALFGKASRQVISNFENDEKGFMGGRTWMLLLLITNTHPYYKLKKRV